MDASGPPAENAPLCPFINSFANYNLNAHHPFITFYLSFSMIFKQFTLTLFTHQTELFCQIAHYSLMKTRSPLMYSVIYKLVLAICLLVLMLLRYRWRQNFQMFDFSQLVHMKQITAKRGRGEGKGRGRRSGWARHLGRNIRRPRLRP